MEILNQKARTISILFFIAFLFSFGLLEYHYSFNPYTWLNPAIEDDFSRSLWLDRRNVYVFLTIITFGGFLVTTAYWFLSWIIGKELN